MFNSREKTKPMILLLTGVLIVGFSWSIGWARIPGLSEFSFFPLWVGYILAINGISEIVLKTSLLRSMGYSFLWLFAISVSLWWFFESLNKIVMNWEYIFPYPISNTRYLIETSIDFSTVIPSVLSTSFLVHGLLLRIFADTKSKPIAIGNSGLVLCVLLGLLSFSLMIFFPREAFPLLWIAPILILEPICYTTGFPSWLREVARGQHLLPISIMTATLFTGFWWELWNYYSLPKWIYHVPYVEFLHVFEMPLLGYLGYPFFGLLVFTYATSVMLLVGSKGIFELFAALTPQA